MQGIYSVTMYIQRIYTYIYEYEYIHIISYHIIAQVWTPGVGDARACATHQRMHVGCESESEKARYHTAMSYVNLAWYIYIHILT